MRSTIHSVTIAAMAIAAIVGIALSARIERQHDEKFGHPSEHRAQLSLPIKNPDQWIVSCTGDAGTPEELVDELDGGTHSPAVASFKVLNPNPTCVSIGSTGQNAADPVDVDNASIVIGTGASCYDGPSQTIDGTLANWGCTSASGAAAQSVRVLAGSN